MDYEQFIKCFQRCTSNKEVAQELGISEKYVSSLASKLRSQGIPLKYRRNLHPFTKDKINALKKLAVQNANS